MHQVASLPRAFLGEEGQLAATGVRSDQREGVGPVDDVHADMAGDEVGDPVAVGDPERDVIEGLGLHAESIDAGKRLDAPPRRGA
jgi:hypothetical protein